MSREKALRTMFVFLFLALIPGSLYMFFFVSEKAKDAAVTVSIADFTKTLNEHIVSDAHLKVSNLVVTPSQYSGVFVTFLLEGKAPEGEIVANAQVFGTLKYSAFSDHFTFSSESLELKDVEVKNKSRRVLLSKNSTKEAEFGKRVKNALERTFANMRIKEMAEPLSGWTWFNSVEVKDDYVTVKYSFKESTHTFFIVLVVIIVIILLILLGIACPECFLAFLEIFAAFS